MSKGLSPIFTYVNSGVYSGGTPSLVHRPSSEAIVMRKRTTIVIGCLILLAAIPIGALALAANDTNQAGGCGTIQDCNACGGCGPAGACDPVDCTCPADADCTSGTACAGASRPAGCGGETRGCGC